MPDDIKKHYQKYTRADIKKIKKYTKIIFKSSKKYLMDLGKLRYA